MRKTKGIEVKTCTRTTSALALVHILRAIREEYVLLPANETEPILLLRQLAVDSVDGNAIFLNNRAV